MTGFVFSHELAFNIFLATRGMTDILSPLLRSP